MAPKTSSDYPTLGFIPAPGDIDAVSGIASTLRNVFEAMDEIGNVLHGADEGEWRGAASREFRNLLDDDVRPKIVKAINAFDLAHHALSTWSTSLESYQTRADNYERWAAEAQAEADRAQSALDDLPPKPLPGAPAPEDKADRDRQADDEATRTSSTKTLGDALADVERYRGYARDLLNDEYKPEGRTHAAKLHDAIEIAPSEPGWFSQAIGSLGDLVDHLGDALGDLADLIVEGLHAIAPLLQLIGDIASGLAAVLGLLSLIPGLQFLAPFALAAAGIALLTHYGARAGETGSLTEPFTEPQFWLDTATVALSATGLGLTMKATSLATKSGNAVPSLFKFAQGQSAFTSTQLNVWLGSYKVNQASNLLSFITAGGTIDSIVKGISGPKTQGPVVK